MWSCLISGGRCTAMQHAKLYVFILCNGICRRVITSFRLWVFFSLFWVCLHHDSISTVASAEVEHRFTVTRGNAWSNWQPYISLYTFFLCVIVLPFWSAAWPMVSLCERERAPGFFQIWRVFQITLARLWVLMHITVWAGGSWHQAAAIATQQVSIV